MNNCYILNPTYVELIKRVRKNDNFYKLLSNKNILITGSTGLLGSALIDYFLYCNYEYSLNLTLYCVFSSPETYKERFGTYPKKILSCLNPIYIDLNNELSVDNKIDFVFHFASISDPKIYVEKPVETFTTNLSSTINILNSLKKNSECIFVYSSSFEACGDLSCEALSENSYGYINIHSNRSSYNESKRASELLINCFSSEYGLKSLILRFGYIFGPTCKLTSSKSDIEFLRCILNRQPIVLKSSGKQKRSYIFVFDAISALLYLLFKKKYLNTFNIACNEFNISLRDFAEKMSQIGKSPLIMNSAENKEKLCRSVLLDPSKLNNTGWRNIFSLNESIKSTIEIKKDLFCGVK